MAVMAWSRNVPAPCPSSVGVPLAMDQYLLAQHSELEWTHWWFRGRRAVLDDVLRRFVPRRQRPLRLLDVGAGAGSMLPTFLQYGEVSAMDTAPEAVAYCERRFPGVRATVGRLPADIEASPTYDVIGAFDVLEHIEDDDDAARAIAAALLPGGVFVCSVPAFMSLWGPHDDLNHHRRRYRRPELVALLEGAGLRVLWSSYFNTLLFAPIAALRLVRRRRRDTPVGGASDFDVDVGRLNGLLARLFSAERHLLRRVSLPFGVSIVAVARREDAP